jgi:tetraacyldisaccharide 4'-kinase
MRAPDFWGPRAGPGGRLAACALAPLSGAFGLAGCARQCLTRPWQSEVPVICVGNLTAGGAGKTPCVLSIVERLAARSIDAHILIRGYGGRARGPLRVDPERHDAREVGDEALLLAAQAPTWVGAKRCATARAAIAAGAQILVMDDGFQNPSLAKDLSLIVVDGGYGFGNGRVMPAGPLREPVVRGLARAQAVVVMGEDATGIADGLGNRLAMLHARLAPEPGGPVLDGQAVVAFAGIGRPDKFFETLGDGGARVVARHAFADHHPYKKYELTRMVNEAEAAGARMVTTEKDAVRLPATWRERIDVVRVRVEWADSDALDALLDPVVERVG